MNPPSSSPRRSLIWAALLPLLLVVTYLRVSLGRAEASATTATPARLSAPADRGELERHCDFPGNAPERQRLIIVIVDSLRDQTALDPEMMPWLAAHPKDSLSGRMRPCLSQLSLLCFRTMFEGSEPLLVTGFNNYTGMSVDAPSLIHRWAERGLKVAAVADQAFIKLYQPSLARHSVFEEKPAKLTRDAFGRQKTFEWLADPSLDIVISHVIDTDATAHRAGVGAPAYVAKFKETDDFLREVAAGLGARDSLIVLGDHGHDANGYHSTGIASSTQYFAQGPLFPAGQKRDLEMASLFFLAGAVTCEPTPALYSGDHPFDALGWSEPRRLAHERATPPKQAASARAESSSLGLDASALGAGLALVLCMLGLLSGRRAEPVLAVSTLGLAVAAVAAHPAVVALAAAGSLFATWRRKIAAWLPLTLVAISLLWNLTFGLLAPWVLVTLQNHVNPQWTIGFWATVVVVIAGLAPLARRLLDVPKPLALGFTALGLIVFGLFLGPYYYGALRLAMFGVAGLLLGFAVHARRSVSTLRLARWLSIAILPTLPVLFPVLKEWQPRWVLLSFTENIGVVGTAAAAFVAVALLTWLSPDRARFVRPALSIAAVFGLGVVTQVPAPVLLGCALIQLAYAGFCGTAAELSAAHPTGRYLLPIGQASYALVLYFMLLGSLRFANVDFRFALAITPIEEGELAAALAAIPFVAVKYFVPVVLMLIAGPRLTPQAPLLIFVKALGLGAGLVGMQLSDSPRLVLFRQLQTQELALTTLLYGVVVLVFVVWSLVARRPESPGDPAA